MTNILFNRWLSIAVRISLGCVLVYSALPKIADPPAFAQMVWNYKLLPPAAVNVMAIVLPWLELWLAAALISGVLRRGAAMLSAILLLVFMAALTVNLYRGVAVDCGCFSLATAAASPEEQFATMRLDVLRDAGLLLLALQAAFSPVTWRLSR